MALFRKWVIASIVFHLLLLIGSGWWLPFHTAVSPEEDYLQIFTDYSMEQKGDPITAVVSKIQIRQEFGADEAGLERSLHRDGELVSVKINPQVPTEKTGDNPRVNDQTGLKTEPTVNSKAPIPDLPGKTQPDSIAVSTGGSPEATNEGQNVAKGQAEGQAGIAPQELSHHTGLVPENAAAEPGRMIAGLPVIDTPAVILKDVKPVYPALARRNGWSGTVVLLVEVKTDGKVGQVTIIKSSGYQILDREVMRAIKKRQYQPNLKDGKPVAVFRRVPYTFKLEG